MSGKMNGHQPTRGDTSEVIAQRERELRHLEMKRADYEQALKRLMAQPDFRMVMGILIAKGGMFQSVFTGNSQTFYLSGRQDFAREVWADLARAHLDGALEILRPNNGETDG